ncbi:MAG: ABC transporter permease subunit [Clostridia bacterium]|nr:ABC transporter permease subunit [Clostridia bacterium]MDE7083756.1 ABC transporter permease subunit [Clostridia bacterium]
MSKLLKYDDFLTLDEESGKYYMAADQKVRDETEKRYWKATGFTILKDWRLYIMLVPMLLVYILWKYAPMYELLAAFKDSNTPGATTVADQKWFGLNNFYNLFFGEYSGAFWPAFRNTFTIAFYNLLFGFPVPIILALLFNEIRSNITRNIIQVCVYLPKFLSTVVVTSIALLLLRKSGTNIAPGILSQFLGLFAPNNAEFQDAIANGLFYSARYFRSLYVITELWEHAGYDSIVFFAAVIAVSPTSYEAAQIDGAGKLQQMRYVVIPSILSTVVIMLIMKIGGLLSVGYEKIYLLYESGNDATAQIIATLSNSWGDSRGVAAEMTNNLIGMILVIGANAVARKAADVSLY